MGSMWRKAQEDDLVPNTKLKCLGSNIGIVAVDNEYSILFF